MFSKKQTQSPPTIIVIGAGIIGLTSALCIQEYVSESELPHKLLLVAREFPSASLSGPSVNYASMWAGAHVRPIPADNPQLEREGKWLKYTTERFEKIATEEPYAGISRVRGAEYISCPSQAYLDLLADKNAFYQTTGLRNFRVLDAHETPPGVALGFEYDTCCINSPLYCMTLLRKFLIGGGKTIKRGLVSELEAFNLAENATIVVNASGMGFNDPATFPIRGQTCLVANTCTKTVTRLNADGSWTFIIPRAFGGGTVIGGTKDKNDWNDKASMKTRDILLRNGKEIFPVDPNTQVEDLTVIADIVGRRPSRKGGMKLEIDRKLGAGGSTSTIVHAYGAGSRRFELSWGIGAEVLGLVQNTLMTDGHRGSLSAKI